MWWYKMPDHGTEGEREGVRDYVATRHVTLPSRRFIFSFTTGLELTIAFPTWFEREFVITLFSHFKFVRFICSISKHDFIKLSEALKYKLILAFYFSTCKHRLWYCILLICICPRNHNTSNRMWKLTSITNLSWYFLK